MTRATESPQDVAGRHQRRAIRAEASVWVAASAGSGKTKVLTDRVLSLLLDGSESQKILCLTFTKAAAAEMANRLADCLARWTVLDDGALAAELRDLTGETPTSERVAHARGLFATVLDTPGGMKIQTIHAFCQALLARFPLEAGVAPHSQVMDEREAAEMLGAARQRTLAAAREGALAEAMIDLAAYADELTFDRLIGQLVGERSRLTGALRRLGGGEAAIEALHDLLGAVPGQVPRRIMGEAMKIDPSHPGPIVEALEAGSEAEKRKAVTLRAWLEADAAGREALYLGYESVFLVKEGRPRAKLLTQGAEAAVPGALAAMEEEAERLAELRRRLTAARVAQANAALLRIGIAILQAYETDKRARALFDYDDLILLARNLLAGERAAPWVLYKLDGGIDHVLIDEAQDTNPEQWEVIRALTEEFFAGEGAREGVRTLFVVGDAKQSIYSFQRADPATFAAMQTFFAEKVKAAGQLWDVVPLDVSFRSTEAVLRVVDAVFVEEEARRGVTFDGEDISHVAVRTGQPGAVEIWPTLIPEPDDEPEPIDTPAIAATPPGMPPDKRLARHLARRIHRWTCDPATAEDPDCFLPSSGRRMAPGDILVLVRRRGAFVEDLVRELKALEVPVAGVDRMVLTEQLAALDLAALGRVMLLPEDDLSLACVLKSPLVGLSEEQLFTLAWNRKGHLWDALAAAAASNEAEPALRAAWQDLSSLRRRAAEVPPFEFYAEVLGARGGRRRILERLGPEAGDPIDEFLSLALFHERAGRPSLPTFLHWLEAGRTEIKRDMEHGQPAVRVMTVHGSKGLQAPVVLLPDTTQVPRAPSGLLWPRRGGGLPVWPLSGDHDGAFVTQAREEWRHRQEEEYRRLLYVAMTRAQDRLYVCGWRGGRASKAVSWYDLVARGLERMAESGAAIETLPDEDAAEGPVEGPGLRFRLGGPAVAQAAGGADRRTAEFQETEIEALPPWAEAPAPAEPTPPAPLQPSRPATIEPALISPLSALAERRFQRGLAIHRLLQYLPDIPPQQRRPAARRFLEPLFDDDAATRIEALVAETEAVLNDPDMAEMFGPGSRAEVPLVGLIEGRDGPQIVSGQVDRLVVSEDAVSIIDYKTNRPPPASESDVPAVYLRQMASYRAVLRRIYPQRRIDCFLLWTVGPRVMRLGDRALAGAAP
jgi:ATP-dependent helicase/nuclease subunit A